ncbi:MAG: AmmeMemoRadiSam system protein B [Nitrospirota bacterium]
MTTTKDLKQYPVLRNLQFSPIKQDEEQYMVLWDPTGLSQEKLVLPLNYFFLVQHLDGEHSLEQIGVAYLKRFGEFLLPDRLARLVADLDAKLFLEGERVEAARRDALAAYRREPVRRAAFAGKSYEADGDKLKAQLAGFFSSKEGPPLKPSANRGKKIRAIVAPHYELREAGPVCAWAYKELQEADLPDLFLLLGTSYVALSNLFAVTDKDFETPLGLVSADRKILDRFRQSGGERFFEEELCHKTEHALEFQLPFLQHTVGGRKPFTILPVLCSFTPAQVLEPQSRDKAELIEQFVAGIGNAVAGSGKECCVVASSNLAHIGLRYGDSAPPTDFSFHRCMQTDLEMLKPVEELNPEAFARFIHKEHDSRRIAGFAPIYTMLRLIQAGKGEVLRYDRGITDQYNSTITYASMAFF